MTLIELAAIAARHETAMAHAVLWAVAVVASEGRAYFGWLEEHPPGVFPENETPPEAAASNAGASNAGCIEPAPQKCGGL